MCYGALMTHRLFALLFLLLPSCASHYPIDKEDMSDFEDERFLYEDDFESRARGSNKAPPGRIVYPIEPRKGPWSANSQLGQSQGFDPDSNNRQSIIKLDEWGMPEVWSVMLGISFTDDNPDLRRFAVTAELTVGSGGDSQKVLVDWKNGAVVNLPMNALDVIALYETSGSNEPPSDLRLSVTMAKGSLSGRSPTLTESNFDEGVPDPAFTRRIPDWVTHLTILPNELGDSTRLYGATVNVQFFGGPDATVTNQVGQVLATDMRDASSYALGIPIPNGARFVRVDNLSGPTQLQYIYSLSL